MLIKMYAALRTMSLATISSIFHIFYHKIVNTTPHSIFSFAFNGMYSNYHLKRSIFSMHFVMKIPLRSHFTPLTFILTDFSMKSMWTHAMLTAGVVWFLVKIHTRCSQIDFSRHANNIFASIFFIVLYLQSFRLIELLKTDGSGVL